uniref:ATP synthase F0 subunit 8 n=1 Tax=Acaudina molpadioides TaxID=545769 RepID=A0A650AMU1_9ECHN|nr:ATP synthase F0 subunit 8 [Acaudina molpadioides]
MPQLDLTWFLFNFILAWSFIFLINIILTNQNWFNNNEDNNIITKTNQKKNNQQWNW